MKTWHLPRYPASVEHVRYAIAYEVVILEEKEDGEIEDEACRQEGPFALLVGAFLDENTAAIGDYGRCEYEQGIGGLPVHIKIVTGGKKEEVAIACCRQKKINNADNGEEYKKSQRVE